MSKSTSIDLSGKRQQGILLIGLLAIAFNLRPSLAAVGPLTSTLRENLGLSNALLGILTTLPLLAFGIISTLTPLVTRRFGVTGTLGLALVLLSIGSGIRTIDTLTTLYLGTAVIGIAIAFGNVLIPSLVKQNFTKNSGSITSLYSGVMGIGAAVAAGITVPLSNHPQLGWQGALGIWSIPAALAFFLWVPQLIRPKKKQIKRSYIQAMKHLGNSTLAWKIALFMGFQSMAFYIILAWLPDMIESRGHNTIYAGWMLSLSQITGVLGSLIIPYWAGKNPDQRKIVWFLITLEVVSIIGLLIPELDAIPIWVSLIGFALGGSFGLCLLLIVVRSSDTETATELSGMVQSIGYLIAATGPYIFGQIFDLTHSWSAALFLLLGVVAIKLYVGLGAAKPGKLSYDA
ncbi:MFS transporter [Flavobacteriaceae bacterium F08102]|nr:MFS transporter [Flavobacteriaceae bacterium F08102]